MARSTTPHYPEFNGMNYEQASREAERLIKAYGWFLSMPKLRALAEIMERELGLGK